MSVTHRATSRQAGIALIALGLSLLDPGALPGQEPETRDERACRCVDREGREIERCTCIIRPEPPGFAMAFGRRALLGVSVRRDQPAEDDEQGARLYGVQRGSPADEAGLQEGDIVVNVAGRSLLEPLAGAENEDGLDTERSLPVQRLLALLSDREPGEEVRVEYLREGERRTAMVEFDEPAAFFGAAAGAGRFRGVQPRPPIVPPRPPASRPTLPPRLFGDRPGPVVDIAWRDDCPGLAEGARDALGWRLAPFGRSCVAGAELVELNPELAEYFGAEVRGVLVLDADSDQPLRLRAGDVIVAVDGRELRGLDHALRVLASYEGGEELELTVLRQEQSVELRGRLP